MVISDIVVPAALSVPSEDGRYIIPKGHTAVASPAFTQVDRKIWKNYAEWDPYRWIDPNGEAARALQEYLGGGEKVDYGYGIVSKGTESVYQPFGAGRHRCIGEHVSCPSRCRIFTGDLGSLSLLTCKLDAFWSPLPETSSSSSIRFPTATTV